MLDELDRELVGLAPVKARIKQIVALLAVERVRRRLGLASETPTLHMSFTGNPGTRQDNCRAQDGRDLAQSRVIVRKGHLVSVTRDDLVGQYIGHTAPKTKEILKKAMGGVLFIDEAYYLYRQENERDYGQEAIEILLQVMENQRDDLVVIVAGYAEPDGSVLPVEPGLSLAHRASHRFPGLYRCGIDGDRGEHARSTKLQIQPGGRGRLRGLYRGAAATAAFRQCKVDPQCA